MQMSPRDQTPDKTSDTTTPQKSTTTASSQQIDQIVDSIAFGQQSDQRSVASDSQSIRSRRSQLSSQLKPQILMRNTIFGIEMPFDVISAAFATSVAVGGIIGYAKAKSTASLMAGLVFGSILGYGAYQTSVNPRNYYLTLGTSAVLGSLMGYRAINSGKFMPAGLIATLSGLMVIRLAVRFFTDSYYIRK